MATRRQFTSSAATHQLALRPPKDLNNDKTAVVVPLGKYEVVENNKIPEISLFNQLVTKWRILTGSAFLDRYEKFTIDCIGVFVILLNIWCVVWCIKTAVNFITPQSYAL